MVKNYFFFLFVFLGLTTAHSQNLGRVKGKIIDVETREVLPFVNVLVLGTNIGVISDENGEFVIKDVPLGYIKLQASFMGYQTLISDDYLVTIEKTPYV